MTRRKIRLRHKKQRPILSDTLPYEVPVSFNNRHYYAFLVQHQVELASGALQWACKDDTLDQIMRVLFGFGKDTQISSSQVRAWGRTLTVRQVSAEECEMATIPFTFNIAHKEGQARSLSICHPRNQVQVAEFYNKFSDIIIYYASLSEFSIRKPASVSKFSYHKDKTHYLSLDKPNRVEESEREYEQIGSYFTYRDYSNIHKFFESYKYHNAERKYDKLLRLDISKCFDSIYTHSLPWALLGKQSVKHDITSSNSTFPGRFDRLIQDLNYRETNGILIGPEFSRIFAELVIQSTDVKLKEEVYRKLKLVHRKDYEIFRYVDDYFIFYNDKSTADFIVEVLEKVLGEVKLHLNVAKSQHYEKPIITEMTIAKERISDLFNADIESNLEHVIANGAPSDTLKNNTSINSNKLIVRYKTVLKETGVSYKDMLNYSFSIIENKSQVIVRNFFKADPKHRGEKTFFRSVIGLIEFCFFIYAASPKVNHTIRLCRILNVYIEMFHQELSTSEAKHQIYKFIYDNVVHQMNKNKLSEFREIESLYLLVALSSLGREYWLEEDTLTKYFDIEVDSSGCFDRSSYMNHFSITVCLFYMKNKIRYQRLRSFIEEHVIKKVTARKSGCHKDAETLMLFLDILACPYVSNETKVKLGTVFDLSDSELDSVKAAHPLWFTCWDNFNFGKELDAKRSREVY